MGWGRSILDSLTNVATGLGLGIRRANSWTLNLRTQQQNEAAYRSSWLARKIHDIPPFDMTRAGRAWQTDKDKIEAIEAEETRLALFFKTRRALTMARLHGGAALILGLPGNPRVEIKPEQVRKGGLAFMHVVTRWQCQVSDLRRDINDPYFGQPTMYTMSGNGIGNNVEIHPSRVVPFISQPLPEGSAVNGANGFWGDPLMQTLNDTIESNETAMQALCDLLVEAKVDVITIPGLMEQVGTKEYESRLLQRLSLAASIKSATNSLLISGPERDGAIGEKWETRQLSFAGLPDVLKIALQVASGAADIPATRLLGQSPAGMDATGESDLRNYYDMLASRQEAELRPAMALLDEILIRSALGSRPSDVHYEWASLWQLTPEQRADVFDKTSKSIVAIANTNLVPTRALEEAVQNRLIEDGNLPGLESALEAMSDEERFPSETAPTEAELAEAMAAAEARGAAAAGLPPAGADQPPRQRAANDATLADASPRTLYVRRDVLNSADIIKHFHANGLPGADPRGLHVTIAFSRTPVDWMKIAADWTREENGGLKLPPGGPRVVEHLGDGGAIVLMFNSWELSGRHADIRHAGASWDYDAYQPHMTLAYDAEHAVDLADVKPWTGEIVLGPEIFEELDVDQPTPVAAE